MFAYIQSMLAGIFSQKLPKKLMTMITLITIETLSFMKNPTIEKVWIKWVNNWADIKETLGIKVGYPVLLTIKMLAKGEYTFSHKPDPDGADFHNPIIMKVKILLARYLSIDIPSDKDGADFHNPTLLKMLIDHSWSKIRNIHELHSTDLTNPTIVSMKIGDIDAEYGIQ